MATIAASRQDTAGEAAYQVWKWTLAANGDDGQVLSLADHVDRSVQVSGNFGTGGTVVIEGSNDGTTFFKLTDYLGNSLTFTQAGLSSIEQAVRYIRPRATAGTGISIDIIMMFKKVAP